MGALCGSEANARHALGIPEDMLRAHSVIPSVQVGNLKISPKPEELPGWTYLEIHRTKHSNGDKQLLNYHEFLAISKSTIAAPTT